MEKNLFSTGSIRTTFAPISGVQGAQQKAVGSISENLTNIGTVMAEGNVLPEYAGFAIQKLYEAKLAVENAIVLGWNGGSKTQY